MAEAKKLGEMLIDAGLIDDFQLESALAHQRNWGRKLGSILIELELIREDDLARVIADKLRVPYINLFEPSVPGDVIALVKPDVAKKYNVVPVKKEKGALVLAMADPLDIEAIDAVRFATGFNIKPSLALDTQIKDAIKKYYDGEEIVRQQTLNPFVQQGGHSSDGKMELIRGSDLTMPKRDMGDASSPILSRDDSTQQVQTDYRARIDALVSLLIEKGLITREELVSMIYQKKMGL